MKVSLDTNVWIFGIVGVDDYCERILFNLAKFQVIVPDHAVRALARSSAGRVRTQPFRL